MTEKPTNYKISKIKKCDIVKSVKYFRNAKKEAKSLVQFNI